jgi:putative membrane protein
VSVPPPDHSQLPVQTSTSLAAARSLMAADRTLLAWIRTSLSLLSFGFTIYKVLQSFEAAGGTLPGRDINTPRVVGLFLTGAGTVAMLMGTIQYVMSLKGFQLLWARDFHQSGQFPLARPPMFMAVLMSISGVVLFVSIITHLF